MGCAAAAWSGCALGLMLACLSVLYPPAARAVPGPTARCTTARCVRTTAALKAALVAVDHHIDALDVAFDDAPGMPAVLEGLWRAVRHWAEVRLEAGEPVRDIVADARGVFGDHGPAGWQTLSAVRLDPDSVVFRVNMTPLGTVFILRRSGPHAFVTAMDIGEPNTWGGANAKAFAAWQPRNATEGVQRGHHVADLRPLTPAQLVRLPSEADGAARFAVVALHAQSAGAVLRFQVSIWRWHRFQATPLLTVNLSQTDELPVIAHVGRAHLILQEKGHFSQFYACAECAGRQLALAVDLPARGARLGAVRSLTPQLDVADTFLRRVLRCQPPGNLMAAALARRLAGALAESCRRGGTLSGLARIGLTTLGMLENVRITRAPGQETLCLTTGNLHRARVFVLARRADDRLRITGYQLAPRSACGYRNTYQVSLTDGGLFKPGA